MRFYYINLFLLVFCGFSSYSQTKSIDSFKKIVQLSKTIDSNKVYALGALSKEFASIDLHQSLQYAQQTMSAAISLKDEDLIAFAYNILGNSKCNLGEFKSALEEHSKSFNIRRNKSYNYLAEYYNYLGLAYWGSGDYPKAELFILKSIAYYDKLNDLKKLSFQYINLGAIYGSQDKSILATDYFYKALRIKEKLKDSVGIAGCYNNLSNVYQRLGEYERCLFFSRNARDIRERNRYSGPQMAGIYNNVGIGYNATNKKDSAKFSFFKSIEIAEKCGAFIELINGNTNLAQLLHEEGKIDSSTLLLNKALQLSEEMEYDEGIMYTTLYLSYDYLLLKNYNKSRAYADRSLSIAKKLGVASVIASNAENIYKIYKEKNDYKNALEWLEQFKTYSDSVLKQENIKEIEEIKYEHELKTKEDKIDLLSKEFGDIDKKYKTQSIFFFGFGILGLFILFFTVLYFQQAKKMSKLNALLEESNKRIASQADNLTQMNVLKDRVISVMSHDMKGPISSLFAILDLMSKNELSQEEIEYVIPELSTSVNSVGILLDNILGWVKTQMVQGNELITSDIDLKNTVDDVIKISLQSAKQKNIELVNLIPEQVFAKANQDNLSLVIRNLVNNAIKFSFIGQKIEVTAHESKESVSIVVKDYGIGMSENVLEKLFKLNTLHTTKGTNNEKGTGLGLLLVKFSVEQMNGKLTIKSEPNIGSEFIITLPK